MVRETAATKQKLHPSNPSHYLSFLKTRKTERDILPHVTTQMKSDNPHGTQLTVTQGSITTASSPSHRKQTVGKPRFAPLVLVDVQRNRETESRVIWLTPPGSCAFFAALHKCTMCLSKKKKNPPILYSIVPVKLWDFIACHGCPMLFSLEEHTPPKCRRRSSNRN